MQQRRLSSRIHVCYPSRLSFGIIVLIFSCTSKSSVQKSDNLNSATIDNDMLGKCDFSPEVSIEEFIKFQDSVANGFLREADSILTCGEIGYSGPRAVFIVNNSGRKSVFVSNNDSTTIPIKVEPIYLDSLWYSTINDFKAVSLTSTLENALVSHDMDYTILMRNKSSKFETCVCHSQLLSVPPKKRDSISAFRDILRLGK